MAEPLQCVPANSVITGWDFSTGAVKCLAFDLSGKTVAEVRLPTDLWDRDGVSELNLMQLEGQARASTRAITARLREAGRLKDWAAGGISATHHTAGRIDANHVPVRRAICWNDRTLATYHEKGLARLGGQEAVHKLIGGPWAIRYTLSHLVKDAVLLPEADWRRTRYILPHGALAAGYLTGNFGVVSVSAAASTGIMDLRSKTWCRAMLDALEQPWQRDCAWQQLPRIVEQDELVGPLADHLAFEAGLGGNATEGVPYSLGGNATEGVPYSLGGNATEGVPYSRSVRAVGNALRGVPEWPLIFPTSDDQQAGLVGGGAVDDGQLAIVLGNSAVVNSSSGQLPASGTLDAMRLNWGPYLWMRCYNNGAQFLDTVVGPDPDWDYLEAEARRVPPGCEGTAVLPFVNPEPSLNVSAQWVEWHPSVPEQPGKKFRAALEALAYLIALAVREHEAAGQRISRITVSGGIARSSLMCEILASVLDRPLYRLVSAEGPALGAAVTALAALENYRRRQSGLDATFTVADAVAVLVKFQGVVEPNLAWQPIYASGLETFEQRLQG